MLNVLAAIQFRSRGEWRNLPYFAISQAFRHREVQKDCQNRKREIGYMSLENCPFLKIAYFQSLFSMWVWFQPKEEGRQGGERKLIYCPPCFWRDLWNVRNPESGMRNSQSFKYSPVRFFFFLFVENHFAFTIIISSLTFNYRI